MFFFRRALPAVLLAHTAVALVPSGHTPSGKPIFRAPPGSRARQSGTNVVVFAPNGSLIHTFENVVAAAPESTLARRQDLSVTEASVTFRPSDPLIQSFKTSFVVPLEPTTFESQIMYFGAGLLGPTMSTLLRAGIQYGGSNTNGGPFWTAVIQLEFLPNGGYFQFCELHPQSRRPSVYLIDIRPRWLSSPGPSHPVYLQRHL
ncbi:hypothetical protein C8F01DRAFT_360184 [Mycena amicta]|nr:hypothetical protein C8F01DRAFT_360184 [Mycena amicta]